MRCVELPICEGRLAEKLLLEREHVVDLVWHLRLRREVAHRKEDKGSETFGVKVREAT